MNGAYTFLTTLSPTYTCSKTEAYSTRRIPHKKEEENTGEKPKCFDRSWPHAHNPLKRSFKNRDHHRARVKTQRHALKNNCAKKSKNKRSLITLQPTDCSKCIAANKLQHTSSLIKTQLQEVVVLQATNKHWFVRHHLRKINDYKRTA